MKPAGTLRPATRNPRRNLPFGRDGVTPPIFRNRFFRDFRGNFLGSSTSSVDRSGLSKPCRVARSAGKGGGTCPLPFRCRQRPGEPPAIPCPESSDLHECLGPGGTGEGSRRQAHAAWAQPPVSQARGRGAPAGAREPWSALRQFMQVASPRGWENRFPRHLRGGMRIAGRIRWQRPRHAGSPTGYRPSSLRDEGPPTTQPIQVTGWIRSAHGRGARGVRTAENVDEPFSPARNGDGQPAAARPR